MTILLVLFSALLLRGIRAGQAFLEITNRLQTLSLTLIADFPWLLLAIFRVAVLLSFLGTSLHLQFTDLFWLEMAVLLLDWKWMSIGKLLTIPVNISLTHFDLDLARNR